MNEIDDKIDYEPGAPESLSFLKALVFMVLAGLILFFGFFVGWIAGSLVSAIFFIQFTDDMRHAWAAIEMYSMLSSLGGVLLAGYFLIPRLYRRFYRW